MTVCGDASYAIYLFHLKILHEGFSAGVSLPLTGYSITYAAVRFALIVTVLLVVAIGIYRVIEFPARRWIRRSLGERIERDLTASYAIVGACVGIPALLAIVGWIITFGWQ
jgi:peptidoglycan/LPS O-acetylase OafA/YrhL